MNAQAILAEFNAARDVLVPAMLSDPEDDVLNELLTGRAQLWRGEGSAMVTQLVAGPEPFVLVWIGGGDLGELLAMRPMVESWARQQGAVAARINGRPGWSRALRDVGFGEADGELRKAL